MRLALLDMKSCHACDDAWVLATHIPALRNKRGLYVDMMMWGGWEQAFGIVMHVPLRFAPLLKRCMQLTLLQHGDSTGGSDRAYTGERGDVAESAGILDRWRLCGRD